MKRRDFKGNVWRELCAQAIERNCGYSGGYHDRYALEWNVSLDWAVPDSDDLLKIEGPAQEAPAFKMLLENWGISVGDFLRVVPLDRQLEWAQEWDDESNASRVWSWVQEAMARGVTESDGYNQLRPEIANRYGLTYLAKRRYVRRTGDESAYYPAALPGWKIEGEWASIPTFDVEWEFAGRGGKHLCLASFEGQSLRDLSDTVSSDITSDSEAANYSNEWCQNLLAFIHECDLMFTRENVKQEFMYQCCFIAADELHDLYVACVNEAKEAAEVAYWNERDVMTEGA